MTAASSSRGAIFTPLCLALCFILSSLIYFELDQQATGSPEIAAAEDSVAAKSSVAAQDAPQEILSFSMPAREAYNEVLERPPFSETRRPAPPGAVAASSDQLLAATVVGTILSSGGVRALIVHGEPAEMTRVVEGQEIEGWTVKSILKDKVVLARGGSTIELKVKANSTQVTSSATAFPQPAKAGSGKPLNTQLLPMPSANNAKAPSATTSTASRAAAPDEAAPMNDATLSQMTGRVSRSSRAQGSSLRGSGRRGK
jgi:type II secretory pathway component PulC